MNATYNLLAAGLSFGLSAVLGLLLIPVLHKINFDQPFSEIGPVWHKKKKGTPTMGGFMFIISTIVACTVVYLLLKGDGSVTLFGMDEFKLVAGLLMALGFSLIGFIDDYIKVIKKRNLGLNEIQKLVMQFVVIGVYLLCVWLHGDHSTILVIPFVGQFDIGLWYYPLMILFTLFFVNAVNLTDGVDGLSSSVTFMVCCAFLVIGGLMTKPTLSLAASALAGGLLGYLIYNFYPAKVFMGDTGSRFMGGCVIAFSFMTGMPLLLVLAGIVYVCEAGSVVLQVLSVKIRKKRLFKMTPIHHSFELSGYSEKAIVFLFSLTALVGGALAVLSIYLM